VSAASRSPRPVALAEADMLLVTEVELPVTPPVADTRPVAAIEVVVGALLSAVGELVFGVAIALPPPPPVIPLGVEGAGVEGTVVDVVLSVVVLSVVALSFVTLCVVGTLHLVSRELSVQEGVLTSHSGLVAGYLGNLARRTG
jgi:hypothetical protein